ncbi:hypothetical protein [Streptomyces aidingensis]|uniref:hypothetical protein n=1 Tax=Streptomyces aidingensis TaxID=910347 RepID=UPI000B81EC4F|nr:hypothetical protein [Streptomyces aidingensis]
MPFGLPASLLPQRADLFGPLDGDGVRMIRPYVLPAEVRRAVLRAALDGIDVDSRRIHGAVPVAGAAR